MKSGKTLTQLAQELERIQKTAKDYIVPVQKLSMVVENKKPILEIDNNGSGKLQFEPNQYSHGQLAGYADIPRQYYERIANQNPELLAESVNHGIAMAVPQAKENPSRMVRTVDGNLRAFLSSRYRVLDSYDLLNTVLPVLIEHGFEVRSVRRRLNAKRRRSAMRKN